MVSRYIRIKIKQKKLSITLYFLGSLHYHYITIITFIFLCVIFEFIIYSSLKSTKLNGLYKDALILSCATSTFLNFKVEVSTNSGPN